MELRLEKGDGGLLVPGNCILRAKSLQNGRLPLY
jgi:hypothetical protein